MSMINENGETVEQAKVDAARAPSVIVIDSMYKNDRFFDNLKAVCGMISKDETRHVLTRVLIEACEVDGHAKLDNGEYIACKVPGSLFVATDGHRLATLVIDRVYAPGTYEIKQAKGKTVVLSEDMCAGVYPNWRQIVPSENFGFSINVTSEKENTWQSVLFTAYRLGVYINADYIKCLPAQDYKLFINGVDTPVMLKAEGLTVIVMPLRGADVGALDREVTRRVVAELAEREEVEKKIQARAEKVA